MKTLLKILLPIILLLCFQSCSESYGNDEIIYTKTVWSGEDCLCHVYEFNHDESVVTIHQGCNNFSTFSSEYYIENSVLYISNVPHFEIESNNGKTMNVSYIGLDCQTKLR